VLDDPGHFEPDDGCPHDGFSCGDLIADGAMRSTAVERCPVRNQPPANCLRTYVCYLYTFLLVGLLLRPDTDYSVVAM
jgi:hypothetical protein